MDVSTSCSKTRVDFTLKPDVRSYPETYVPPREREKKREKKDVDVQNFANTSTTLLYVLVIPELRTHERAPRSSLDTPP